MDNILREIAEGLRLKVARENSRYGDDESEAEFQARLAYVNALQDIADIIEAALEKK